MSVSASVVTTVDTSGIDELIAKYALIPAIVAKYADLIVAEMRRLARVDSGEMRDSIVAHLEAWAAEMTIGEGLPDARAVFNEYGTAHMAAQPMARPAMERYGPAFAAEIAAVIGG
jgi:HK97 gp10 family phage protein